MLIFGLGVSDSAMAPSETLIIPYRPNLARSPQEPARGEMILTWDVLRRLVR